MDVLVAMLVVGMIAVIAFLAYISYRRHARRARATSAAAHARLAIELHLAEQERNRRKTAQPPGTAAGDSGVEIGEFPQEPHA